MKFKATTKKEKMTYLVIFLYSFFLILTFFISPSLTNAVSFNYTAPELYNSETGTDNVNTDNTKTDTIYVDKDGNTITDSNTIQQYQTSSGTVDGDVDGKGTNSILNAQTNINFQGFVTPTAGNGTNYAPLLYRYLYKNGLANYTSINPYNFYYDGYYYFFRNNSDYSYKTFSLDLNKNYKTKFIQKFRTHDLGNKSNQHIELGINGQKVTFDLDQSNSFFKYNGTEVSRHAYFNDKGELIGPNVFNTKYGFANDDIPHNLSLVVSSQDNGNGTSDLSVELQKQINKNVIIWNGNGSEYDLVHKAHVYSVNSTSWYDYAGYLYNKYNYDSFSTSLGKYTTDRLDSVPDYDAPKLYARLVPQFSNQWTDYYLPVEIYNGTIIMNVYPTHNDQLFGIVSTKNAERRFDLIMGSKNNSVQKAENGNTQYTCSGMLDHGYNEWYRLVYEIQTRNGKQEVKLVTYWYDRNGTSGHVWVKNGECSSVFNTDYSGWKPNIFNHSGYSDMGLGQIIIIPKDNIWKVGHPGWTISSYYNSNSSHPNNLDEFLSMLNTSVDQDKTHFYGQNTYMYPMFGAIGTRLGTNGKINHFGSGHGGNLINRDQSDRYINVIKGYFNAKENGKYCFGVDGDDYVGVYIDGQKVVAWTGGHGRDKQQGKYHNGCIDLSKGFHKFTGLHEEITGGDNFIFYVKNPWDNDYHVISPEKGEIYSTIFTENGKDYKTTNTYYELPIKGLKNKELSYEVKNSSNIMLNGIKYYGLSKSNMNNESLKEYAYNLLLNRNLSIYNDDLEQDINSYNAEFWLINNGTLNYKLLSSIDRIGGIRNFDIMTGSDDMGPHNIPSKNNIPTRYYSKNRNQIGYDIDTSWLYDNGLGFSPLGLKWRRNTLKGYILYSDLKQYGDYDKIGIINNVSSYIYSGDNDYRSWLYSSSNGLDFDKSFDAMAEQSGSSNRSKENTVYLHKNDYSKKISLTFPDNREFKLNNNYIYDKIGEKVTQNDKMGYFGVDTTSYDYPLGGNIWLFSNDNDNDGSYRRTKSYYNNFKVYNITINTNKDKLGLSKDKPALSCSKIYNADSNSVNGYYWVKLDNNNIYKLFCDFREPFRGITEYVDIKKDYSPNDARNCWNGSYIYNDALECYNPNRYTSGGLSKVDKLYIFNDFSETDGGYYIYDIKNEDKAVDIRKKGSNYNTLGNVEWMSIMQSNGSGNVNYSNYRRVWLGVNYEYFIKPNAAERWQQRQYAGIDSGGSNMNYSNNGEYGKRPGSRESSARKGRIFWKEPVNTP